MGKDLYEQNEAFRNAFDSADLPFDYKALCFEGSEEQLSDTRYTQPCMVAFACGVTAALKAEGIEQRRQQVCPWESILLCKLLVYLAPTSH